MHVPSNLALSIQYIWITQELETNCVSPNIKMSDFFMSSTSPPERVQDLLGCIFLDCYVDASWVWVWKSEDRDSTVAVSNSTRSNPRLIWVTSVVCPKSKAERSCPKSTSRYNHGLQAYWCYLLEFMLLIQHSCPIIVQGQKMSRGRYEEVQNPCLHWEHWLCFTPETYWAF